ncbi:MAG: 50S ribosomal protein L21e [Candidatus Aenigmatarchaeota archaeon]|nr:MAG: 50S ribosomal protein L21e [Candidatus Aenigmarchaeota archaeon]
MARFGHGKISKSRNKLIKSKKKEGITKYLKKFEIGEKVVIKIDSSSQNYPHPRYHGLIGEVSNTQGKAYIVDIIVGNKQKHIISVPEHLKKHSTTNK